MRLIDADALIRDIDCSADLGGELGKVVNAVKLYAKAMVQTAPTIEERKKGKWIEPKPKNVWSYDIKAYAECFICGHVQFLGDRMNFCPNCGSYNGGGDE